LQPPAALTEGELGVSWGKTLLRKCYPAYFNRKLARANLQFHLLLDGVKGHALFTVSRTGMVTSWNSGAERIFGYTKSDVMGQHLSRFYSLEDIQAGVPDNLLQAADCGGRTNDEGWQVRKDGSRFFAEGSFSVLGEGDDREFGRQTHDITERRSAAEALRQLQRVDAIGRLAGGVAHDFNNLLTVILGYSEILLERIPAKDPLRQFVQIISDTGSRAASLTRQLLTFSRQTVLEPVLLDLNELIRESKRMLQPLISEDILFTTVLDPAIHTVRVDPCLLNQILVNLVINARDAMPAGGKLTVETSTVIRQHTVVDDRCQIPIGRYVVLLITDTGCGLTPQTKVHISDPPLLTTKETGKGTGLGIPVVYDLVKQSDGYIEVFSEPHVGTTFKIYLPAVEQQVDTLATLDSATSNGQGETILLVEDEKYVRELALHALKARGYEVLAATDGRNAQQIADEFRGRIDLLITDVVMPRMNGRQLTEALRRTFPTIKVLYTSGYTDDAVVLHGILRKEVSFLQKPYTPALLTKKVRSVLNESAALATSAPQ